MYKANRLGIELYFYANTYFCFIESIWPLVTWVKTIYRRNWNNVRSESEFHGHLSSLLAFVVNEIVNPSIFLQMDVYIKVSKSQDIRFLMNILLQILLTEHLMLVALWNTAVYKGTVWPEIFAGVYICGSSIFCIKRELIFIMIVRYWSLLLGINFLQFSGSFVY